MGQVGQAKADVRTAELNLSYTKIYAPVSRVIGRKTVEIGQRIQPGESLLAIVPVDDIWVTANFKETQVKHMQPGQAVTIHVDAFDRDYRGTVENLPGAAGTLFSLLPPENASGNCVKVVQRLPGSYPFQSEPGPEAHIAAGYVSGASDKDTLRFFWDLFTTEWSLRSSDGTCATCPARRRQQSRSETCRRAGRRSACGARH
jgi:membrane fusion protein (multidrug efflux system)